MALTPFTGSKAVGVLRHQARSGSRTTVQLLSSTVPRVLG